MRLPEGGGGEVSARGASGARGRGTRARKTSCGVRYTAWMRSEAWSFRTGASWSVPVGQIFTFHVEKGEKNKLFNSQITAEHTRPRGSGPWARRTTQAVVIEGSVRGCETNADAAG